MIKVAVAAEQANATAGSPEIRAVDSETKDKRQVNQYLRTPGTSAITIRTDSGPQVFPIQLPNGIHNQQRVPLYTRRPTTVSKPNIVENEEEHEAYQQQQV